MAPRRFISAVGSGLLVLLLCGTALAAGPYAYITHYEPLNAVSVIDTSSRTVVKSIPVGVEPNGVATIPGRAYVTNSKSDTVSVIDAATNTVIDTIPVGRRPFAIAADLSGQYVWVANQDDHTLSRIDTASHGAPVVVRLEGKPIGIAVHPAGDWVFVTNASEGRLDMVSTTTLSVVHRLPVGSGVNGVAVSPDGTRVWVPFGNRFGTLAVIDTVTPARLPELDVAVGHSPYAVAVDPRGSRVYVGNAFDNSISVIDAGSSTKLATISGFGWGTAGLSVHPSAPQLWVASEDIVDAEGRPGVVVIDTTTNTMIDTPIEVDHFNTSFGSFITAPVAQGCDDGPVEQALRTVEEAIRRSFNGNFAVRGGTTADRVLGLGFGVTGLTRGHLTGVYHNLRRLDPAAGEADTQICDEGLKETVERMLSSVQGSLQGVDKKFYLRGSTVGRLQHLADALASLDRGRLQGLYWNLWNVR